MAMNGQFTLILEINFMFFPIAKGVPSTSTAAKPTDALRTHKAPPTLAKKRWTLHFQSYALDPDEPVPVPLETREVIYFVQPSPSELNQLRKMAHRRGYQLVAITESPFYSEDEAF
jgi:hypothetical protein